MRNPSASARSGGEHDRLKAAAAGEALLAALRRTKCFQRLRLEGRDYGALVVLAGAEGPLQSFALFAQAVDLFIDSSHDCDDPVALVLTSGRLRVRGVEERANLVETETQGLQRFDESESRNDAFIVAAVAGVRPSGSRQQAAPLVVADGIDRDACTPSNDADFEPCLHIGQGALTLVPGPESSLLA